MHQSTEQPISHKARALDALADSVQEYAVGAAGQRAQAHATLHAAEQLEAAVEQLRRLADAQEHVNKHLFDGGVYKSAPQFGGVR